MSLILKSDIKYTGVVAARHILEFLGTAQEKTTYLKNMLSTINADNTYVTVSTSPLITDKLLAHVKRVQKLGATVLSMEYTLKAIIFVTKNALQDIDFTAISPDFGIRTDGIGNAIAVYGIGTNSLLPSGQTTLKLSNTLGQNILASKIENLEYMKSSRLQRINTGIIVGKCLAQGANPSGLYKGVTLKLDEAGEPEALIYSNVGRSSIGSSLTILIPTTSARAGAQIELAGGDRDYFNLAGVVVKYEYGTNNNKAYRNGVEIMSDSGANIMFDMSALLARVEVSSNTVDSGIAEAWIINSKDTLLAIALSSHLNRQ